MHTHPRIAHVYLTHMCIQVYDIVGVGDGVKDGKYTYTSTNSKGQPVAKEVALNDDDPLWVQVLRSSVLRIHRMSCDMLQGVAVCCSDNDPL